MDYQTEVVDKQKLMELLELIGGDLDSLRELIDCFLLDGPSLLDAMMEGAKSSNFEKIRRAAHTLKSNTKDFGIQNVGKLSAELEAKCKASNFENCEVMINEINAEYKKGIVKLEVLYAELNEV